jgi:ATP-dependent DNA ligase
MELVQQASAFDHDKLLFEIKYDGFRALAYIEDGCGWRTAS